MPFSGTMGWTPRKLLNNFTQEVNSYVLKWMLFLKSDVELTGKNEFVLMNFEAVVALLGAVDEANDTWI